MRFNVIYHIFNIATYSITRGYPKNIERNDCEWITITTAITIAAAMMAAVRISAKLSAYIRIRSTIAAGNSKYQDRKI